MFTSAVNGTNVYVLLQRQMTKIGSVYIIGTLLNIFGTKCFTIVTGFAKRDHIPHFMKIEIASVS